MDRTERAGRKNEVKIRIRFTLSLVALFLLISKSAQSATIQVLAPVFTDIRIGKTNTIFQNRGRYLTPKSKKFRESRPEGDWCELVIYGYTFRQSVSGQKFVVSSVKTNTSANDSSVAGNIEITLYNSNFLNPGYLDCRLANLREGEDVCGVINDLAPEVIECRNDE